MKEKNYAWHKIAGSIAEIGFSSNSMKAIEVAGKSICIVLQNGIVLACTNNCPHAGGMLSEGYVDGLGNIVCPSHHYKFSLQNGRNISGEGYFLKAFPVEIRKEGIYIGFEENNLLNWLK